MATLNYNRRSTDMHNLLETIAINCKGTIAHTAKTQVRRLNRLKMTLEYKLFCLSSVKTKGFISYLKYRSELSDLRKQIADVNQKIMTFIQSIYSYFVAPRYLD